jgi:signal peptidase II
VALDLRRPGRVFVATALIVLMVDQLAKAVVRATLTPQQPIPLVPHVFELIYVRNLGAAFGLFPGGRPVFITTSLLVLFVIAAYWRHARPKQWPIVVALALVSAGALGNLIDRAAFGQVTDFFNFTFVDFPVFNVADSAIVVGAGVLMAWILFGPEPESETEDGAAGGECDTAEDATSSPNIEATDVSATATASPAAIADPPAQTPDGGVRS